ncbi:MAG: hypothetical protein LBG80_12860 [Bacteroidales bacterium]|jgi:hypothetical protein|nr:hypothetical protein [Bacteroidales bacterium]
MGVKKFCKDFNIKNQLFLKGSEIFSFIMGAIAGFLAEIIFGDYVWWYIILQAMILLIIMILCIIIIQISAKFNAHYYALNKNFQEAKKNIYENESTRLFGKNSKKIIKCIIPSIFLFFVILFGCVFFIHKSDNDKINLQVEFNQIRQHDSIIIKQLENIEQKNDILQQQVNENFTILKLQNQQQHNADSILNNKLDSINKNAKISTVIF